ncbi:hypothetical protein [Flavobacterium selenitireducens]|uniref:hypothetical protein n=1 Tax=Flavobacterium selenitireducens TaxID=2722704 RepID=UPI00168B4A34|nr:hypothetical protein [Flavobacterium selenitireducens]MBD3582443.1 hypothetical protein [Flavobacterium selenitireducens]
MKTIHAIRAMVIVASTALMVACGTQYRGSAADRSGTNGATNGNGKIPSTTTR